MTEINEAIADLESYGKTLADTANRASGISRTEIVELNRRIEVVRAALGVDAAASEDEADKPLSRMNKAELEELAAERGIEIPDGATVPEIRDLLRDEE